MILTTATAHHLPYEWLLCFAKDKLKKGGRLIIQDIEKADLLSDYIIWSIAFFPNIFANLIKNHMHDEYMTIKEIKSFESIIYQFNYIPESSVMCSETMP